MKFLQLENGDFINVEHISHVYFQRHEHKDGKESFFPKLVDIRGTIHDFFDAGHSFNDLSGESHEIDSDHVISLNEFALKIIAEFNQSIIRNDDLTDHAWSKFLDYFERNKKK